MTPVSNSGLAGSGWCPAAAQWSVFPPPAGGDITVRAQPDAAPATRPRPAAPPAQFRVTATNPGPAAGHVTGPATNGWRGQLGAALRPAPALAEATPQSSQEAAGGQIS